jgi:hypothetical protein
VFDPASAAQYNEADVAAPPAAVGFVGNSSEAIGMDYAARVALVEWMQDMRTAMCRLNIETIPKDPEGAPHNT